METTKMMVMTV